MQWVGYALFALLAVMWIRLNVRHRALVIKLAATAGYEEHLETAAEERDRECNAITTDCLSDAIMYVNSGIGLLRSLTIKTTLDGKNHDCVIMSHETFLEASADAGKSATFQSIPVKIIEPLA